MNHPVPVSMNGAVWIVTGPVPQFMVTSAPTSEVTSTTAGVARRMASCTVSADAGFVAAREAPAIMAPTTNRLMVANLPRSRVAMRLPHRLTVRVLARLVER